MKRSSGFTLIELIIVVAIIAILASLAVAAHSVYIARTQFSEALTITNRLKSNLLDYYHQTGQCPPIGGIARGLESNSASYTGHYVAAVDVTQSPACASLPHSCAAAPWPFHCVGKSLADYGLHRRRGQMDMQ